MKMTNMVRSATMLSVSVALSGAALFPLKAVASDALAKPEHSQSETVAQGSSQITVSELSFIAQDTNQPEAQRVEALQALSNAASQNALVAVARGLKDDSAKVREAAILGAKPYPLKHRWRLVAPLLTDTDKLVRLTAATNLVRDYATLTDSQKSQLMPVVEELKQHLTNQPQAAYQLLLADVERWTEEWQKADKRYHQLLSNDQSNPQIWLSLADNYRAQGKDNQAIVVLDQAIELAPSEAALHYAKSLAYVRLENKVAAAKEIQLAVDLAENNSYYWYLNGVLQEEFDIDKSTRSFEQAYMISGDPVQLYAVCDMYVRYDNDNSDACLEELAKSAPANVIDELKLKKGKI